ncbi:hypothetical protein DVH05_002250 [Phytophthora capsici]|nr:hypothetical protein DVH05_002250 [Phytophthora capsici]
MPMLQSMSSASQEDDECEDWQSHESPDELVILDPTAIASKSKQSTPLATQLWPCTAKSATEKNIDIDQDGSLSSEFSHWSSSDSDSSDLSSLIDSAVFNSLPRDVRDLIDDCSVRSNNDNIAVEPFPDDVEHLEDRPTSRITTENSSSCALSGPFSTRRQRSNSDSTVSTAPLTAPSDVLLAIEPDKATLKDAFTPSTSTPFGRLQVRIAAKCPSSSGNSVLMNSCHADRGATDSRQDRLHRSDKRQHHPRADTEARPPQNLIHGRIDQVRVQEVEQFASRRVQSSTRTWKKAIVIERVTKAWTEVARFAFRPNAAGT